MAEGWVRLHRKIGESAVMADAELCRLWVWLLINANYQTRQLLDGRVLNPGELVISTVTLGKRFKCAQSTILRRLKRLETLKNLHISPHTSGTLVSLCNWETYQNPENADAYEDAYPTHTPRIPHAYLTHTEEEGKKERKKERKKNTYTQFDDFWTAYPKRNGRRVGKATCRGLWTKLSDAEHNDVLKAVVNYADECGDYPKDPERFLKANFWKDYLGEAEDAWQKPKDCFELAEMLKSEGFV